MIGWRKNVKLERLKRLPVFAGCTRRELKRICAATDIVDFAQGSVIVKEGGIARRECFLMLDGEAVVLLRGQPIAMLQAGSIVGEMALLDRLPRSATVIAVTPMKLLAIGRKEFTMVLETCPAFAWTVLTALVERLRDAQCAA